MSERSKATDAGESYRQQGAVLALGKVLAHSYNTSGEHGTVAFTEADFQKYLYPDARDVVEKGMPLSDQEQETIDMTTSGEYDAAAVFYLVEKALAEVDPTLPGDAKIHPMTIQQRHIITDPREPGQFVIPGKEDRVYVNGVLTPAKDGVSPHVKLYLPSLEAEATRSVEDVAAIVSSKIIAAALTATRDTVFALSGMDKEAQSQSRKATREQRRDAESELATSGNSREKAYVYVRSILASAPDVPMPENVEQELSAALEGAVRDALRVQVEMLRQKYRLRDAGWQVKNTVTT